MTVIFRVSQNLPDVRGRRNIFGDVAVSRFLASATFGEVAVFIFS